MNSDEYNDTESDTEKRAYHNLLERKRRDHIKDSFTSLKEVLPAFKGEKVKASRAQILKKAVDFIQNTTRKNQAHVNDIADLKRENVLLEEQIRTLQEAIETGNLDDIPDFAMGQHSSAGPSNQFSSSSSSSDSDSEDQDDEDSTDSSEEDLPKPRCKRRKVDAKSSQHV